MDRLACLAVQHPVVVFAGLDRVTVYLLNNTAFSHSSLLDGKGTSFDDFFNLQTVTFVAGVKEQSQTSRLERGTIGIIAGSCMRTIQFAQHLAQHVTEVVVVIDVRQELFVSLAIALPVDTMNLGVVELVLDLTPNVVK